MEWIICILVLIKQALINNCLMLMISNVIVLYSNATKVILCIISYRNQLR